MIEIQNRTRIPAHKKLLLKIGNHILAKEGKEDADVSVALLSAREMRAINKTRRNKDAVSNVLSFQEREFGLGEIVLCPSRIRKEAKEYGIIYKEELARMFVHGLLHLLGYEHERGGKEAKSMEQKERRYLAFIT